MLEVKPISSHIIQDLIFPNAKKQTWESHATTLANADNDSLFETYAKIAESVRINMDATEAKVVFARDTRASGSTLVAALSDALTATHTEFVDHKLMTTPQLHYITRCTNTYGSEYHYGEISEVGYYEKLSSAFKRAMKNRKTKGHVTVDCANGVGGPKLREIIKYLPTAEQGGVDIKVVNDDVVNPESLNVSVECRLSLILPYIADMCIISAARTMSRHNNGHHRPRRQLRLTVAHHSTVTPIVSSITTSTKTAHSTSSTVTE
jgi:phosphomannomutase